MRTGEADTDAIGQLLLSSAHPLLQDVALHVNKRQSKGAGISTSIAYFCPTASQVIGKRKEREENRAVHWKREAKGRGCLPGRRDPA